MAGAVAAAVALCLSSCGGGTEEADASSRPDISPHKLVPMMNDVAVVYIRGVVLCDTGWEMGSSTDIAPGPPDGPPRLDDTETMLMLSFHYDGSFEMNVPFSTFVDDPTQLEYRGGVAVTRTIELANGRWWQTSTADNTHNLILGINFDISDTGEDPGLVDPARNPSGIWTWHYHGDNICLHLRERTNAPDAALPNGGYRFDGYVASGTMTVNAQRNDVTTSFGGSPTVMFIKDTYNFWGQPVIYGPGENWVPPEDDPLKIKEEE